jgi:hypothetical protein
MKILLQTLGWLVLLVVPLQAAINIDTAVVQKSIVFIYGTDSQGMEDAKKPLGTGFLIAIPQKENLSGKYLALVTARHILDPAWNYCSTPNPQRVFMRMNKKNYDPTKGESGVQAFPIQLIENGKTQYFVSDDPLVDAAVVNLDWKNYPPDQYDYVALELAVFANPSEIKALSIGDWVVSAGLIPGTSGEKRNYPFFKFGNISSIPGEPIWSQCEPNMPALRLERVWFIAANLVPGNSGSPIFYVPAGAGGIIIGSNIRTVLIGVQSTSILLADVSGMTPIQDVFKIIEAHAPDADLYRGSPDQRPKPPAQTIPH